MESVNLLSWNIKSGGFDGYDVSIAQPQREEAILDALHENCADTVSLLDAHRWGDYYDGPAGIAKHLNCSFADFVKLDDERLNKDDGRHIGIAFGTNLPVELSRPLDLDTRQGMTTILNIGKHGLQIASVYLDDMSENVRRTQLRALNSDLERDIPTVVVGDFNMLRPNLAGASLLTRSKDIALRGLAASLQKAKPGSELTQSIAGMNERRVYRQMSVYGFHDMDTRKQPTAPAKLPIFGLDYVFHNDAVKPVSLSVEPTKASDHRIIRATVEV